MQNAFDLLDVFIEIFGKGSGYIGGMPHGCMALHGRLIRRLFPQLLKVLRKALDPLLESYEPENGVMEVGTLDRVRSRAGPFSAVLTTRTERLEPPSRAVFVSVRPARPVHVRSEDTLEPTGDGCRYRVVFTVTDLTKVIAGVRTVVIWDQDFNDGELIEAEIAFFAQDTEGHVWHFGQYPEEYEDGELDKAPAWLHGLQGATAGIAITMLSGSGNADIGGPMTLNSITAVVIGGTALSGGIGGVVGPVMGAITLGIIQNIISFAPIDTWWTTFVKAAIIVVALAMPGIVTLFRRRRS